MIIKKSKSLFGPSPTNKTQLRNSPAKKTAQVRPTIRPKAKTEVKPIPKYDYSYWIWTPDKSYTVWTDEKGIITDIGKYGDRAYIGKYIEFLVYELRRKYTTELIFRYFHCEAQTQHRPITKGK